MTAWLDSYKYFFFFGILPFSCFENDDEKKIFFGARYVFVLVQTSLSDARNWVLSHVKIRLISMLYWFAKLKAIHLKPSLFQAIKEKQGSYMIIQYAVLWAHYWMALGALCTAFVPTMRSDVHLINYSNAQSETQRSSLLSSLIWYNIICVFLSLSSIRYLLLTMHIIFVLLNVKFCHLFAL